MTKLHGRRPTPAEIAANLERTSPDFIEGKINLDGIRPIHRRFVEGLHRLIQPRAYGLAIDYSTALETGRDVAALLLVDERGAVFERHRKDGLPGRGSERAEHRAVTEAHVLGVLRAFVRAGLFELPDDHHVDALDGWSLSICLRRPGELPESKNFTNFDLCSEPRYEAAGIAVRRILREPIWLLQTRWLIDLLRR